MLIWEAPIGPCPVRRSWSSSISTRSLTLQRRDLRVITVKYATQATPGRPNEDFVLAGPSWLVLLDGATEPAGVNSGCIHHVPWLVRHLGGALAMGLTTNPDKSLAGLLAEAIEETCAAHVGTCDLSNPASPSSTVATIRRRDDSIDFLLLSDSSLLLEMGNGVRHVTDDRTAHLLDYSVAGVQAVRNKHATPVRPSFWVASTLPEAAYMAVTGSVPAGDVGRIALLTDGAARWVDRFHLGEWDDLLSVLAQDGPSELIRQVRVAENDKQNADLRGKRHDDATAALCIFEEI